RAMQRAGVLLDRAEFRRGLCPDDGQQVLGLFLGELVGLEALGFALLIADVDHVGRAELQLGAQAERLVLGEVLVPVREQRVVVRHPVLAPVLDRVVIALGKNLLLDFHAPLRRGSSGRSSACNGDGANPIAWRNPATPASFSSTNVRTLATPACAKCASNASNISLPRSLPRNSGWMP